jgi:hypothetical protein
MSYIKPQITPPSPLFLPSWRVKTADNSGGFGFTTWKTGGKYSPLKFAGWGETLGERFGLAHFSNDLWFLDDFSKLHDIRAMFFLILSQVLKLVLLM